MMGDKASLADRIRDVPETAVRILLRAKAVPSGNGQVVIELDGRTYSISHDVYDDAVAIAKALTIRSTQPIEYATDVLELRHRAEELFLESLTSLKGLPKVLFAPAAGELASAWYRAKIPMSVLDENGEVGADWTANLDLKKALRYDVLWIQLVAAPAYREIARLAQAQGVKIVYDVDDRFDAIPGDNPAAALYVERKVEDVWKMIELADVVTVSTRPLADYIASRSQRSKDIQVLPNMVPAAIWPPRAPADPEVFRVLWAGSPTHQRDLAVVVPALLQFLSRQAGRARFTLFGETLPEALVPAKGCIDQKPFVDFTEWGQAFADTAADVVIAPLVDDEFNACKSAIRVVEAGACGFPILCSPVGEYPWLATIETSIRIVPDDGWLKALNEAYAMRSLLKEEGRQLHNWVLKNRCILRAKAAPWRDIVLGLVKKKEGELSNAGVRREAQA